MNLKQERILSLDALRGFDMFWIIGGDLLFRTLGQVTDWTWADGWAKQMDHVAWEGFHAYDLVFPLFMFISGVAIPFALLSKIEKGTPKKQLYKKIITRALILVGLGLVYNGLLYFDFKNIRAASVLGQIGLAYLVASLIVLNTKSFLARLYWFLGIIIGYAAIQLWIPVPEFGAGALNPEGSINSFIDSRFLPGTMYGGTFDPEGLLCIISASALTLLGSLAGELLRSTKFTNNRKVVLLSSMGLLFILMALTVSGFYPIIKSVWTSSFNLLTGGISLLLLAGFYLVIDVWKFQKWSFVFKVIGLNSITIYMAKRIIDFWTPADFLLHGVAGWSGDFQSVIIILGMLSLEWLLLYFLYKRSLFLKV
ncbi:MAG TPA: DUF5009 domain-containing protein [Marinilabiliales bacterium]|nr:MAG: hypothetical protein A2W84_04885 [Bacteroidetes bacterium GWC2_40_13]OFX74474.1 MAG: hypothetical protein A2W96_02930 [Bacteroidetes bacterium GWD2_40_43]OFX91888.1 MAG: hypothetical protein A2W97_11990 [Bacteroidetes bacterium GWE2_40_63]OFY19814.1 MAG: hypothetical protein A2W88_03445 [Bacteroidetes bacterium GWF2_40_13]OFZ28225.1 MAG: hypothetical protein A2437_04950 [Bacteroidetes bacterium RIFOXYC2_FULL_40_12]HAM97934.1 DUF5009 domain-containing protein [Marinilabiliales bacterium